MSVLSSNTESPFQQPKKTIGSGWLPVTQACGKAKYWRVHSKMLSALPSSGIVQGGTMVPKESVAGGLTTGLPRAVKRYFRWLHLNWPAARELGRRPISETPKRRPQGHYLFCLCQGRTTQPKGLYLPVL